MTTNAYKGGLMACALLTVSGCVHENLLRNGPEGYRHELRDEYGVFVRNRKVVDDSNPAYYECLRLRREQSYVNQRPDESQLMCYLQTVRELSPEKAQALMTAMLTIPGGAWSVSPSAASLGNAQATADALNQGGTGSGTTATGGGFTPQQRAALVKQTRANAGGLLQLRRDFEAFKQRHPETAVAPEKSTAGPEVKAVNDGMSYTVTDDAALIRVGPPNFEKEDDTIIPLGTKVRILKESTDEDGRAFVEVEEYVTEGTSGHFGWTLKSNLTKSEEVQP